MNKFIRLCALMICLVMLTACSANSADGTDILSSVLQSSTNSEKQISTQSALTEAISSTEASEKSEQTSENSSKQSSAVSSKKTSSKQSSAASSKKTSSKQSSATSSKKTSSKTSSAVSSTLPSINVESFEKYSGTRDPWLWPFAATSIWNMPIGSNAQLQKAGFQTSKNVGIDDEYHVIVPDGSPIVEVYAPSSWKTRWPGSRKLGTMQVPADFYLADAREGSTPNNCAAFLMPDGRTIRQLEPCCRLETGNDARIVGYLHDEDQDIFGDGIKGTHYGSGLSAIGGSIRKGELTSDEPIRHALKLNVYAKKYLYYDTDTNKGYIWPADRHDSYAGGTGNNAYGGSNPNLRMGTLLTIPQNATAESLGLKTEVGKKLFYALQNYGCYIADDSAWDSYSWSAEAGVRDEVQNKYGHKLNGGSGDYFNDCMKLITNLYIVTNNSPTTIGGGGTPCKPLAPDFE